MGPDPRDCDFVLTEMLKSNFTLHRGTEEVSIHPENSRILVNSINATRTAVLAGLGLQRLPSQEVHKDIADGKLVHVLPEWSLPKLSIFAVWPASGPRNSLVRLLLDFLKNGERSPSTHGMAGPPRAIWGQTGEPAFGNAEILRPSDEAV